MSPEEWLAQQTGEKPKTGLSPEDWLAQQTAQPQVEQPKVEQNKKPALSPEAWLAQQYEQEAASQSGNFMRGVGNVPGQFQETWGAAKALAGVLSNSKDLVKSGLESMEEGKTKQTGKESDSFSNAWKEGIGTVLTDWLPYQMGSGVGNIAETLAFSLMGGLGGGASTGGVGALPGAIAGAVSKTLIKEGIETAAKKIAKESGEEAAKKFVEAETKRVVTEAGQVAAKQYAKAGGKSYGQNIGMGLQAGIHGAGEVTGRAIEEAGGVENIDTTRVVPAAVVHGIADYMINKIGLGALGVSTKSLENLALDIGKQVFVTGAKETPAELIQTAAERYGAKLSLADADALKEYVDTTAAAFGMSVGPGGVGGVRTNLAHKFANAAKQDTTSEEELKKQSTSARDVTQKAAPPADQELVAGLTPAMDENKKALASVSADTTAAGTELKAIEDAKTAEEAGKVKTAEELLAKVDAGEKIKRDDIHAIAKSLGVKLPLDARTNEAKINLIRQHIQGASNVAGSQQPAAGTSTNVAVPTNTGAATTGAGTTVAGGVDVTNAAAAKPAGGKTTQPAPVKTREEQIAGQAAYEKAKDPSSGMMPIQDPRGGGNYAVPLSMFGNIGLNTPIKIFGDQTLATVIRRGGIGVNEAVAMLEGLKDIPSEVGIEKYASKYPQLFGIQSTTPTSTEVIKEAPAETAPKSIADLSPEIQEQIAARQDKIAEIEMEGGDASKQKANLNKLLAKYGITGTLSAKPTVSKLPRILGPGNEKTDQELEAERVTEYQKSLGKTIPDYDISEEDKRLYEETREEVNSQVDKANEKRVQLVKEQEDAIVAFENAAEKDEEAAWERLVAAEKALKEHGPEQRKLPNYSKKFSPDYKDVYFGNISAGPIVGGRLTFGSSKREHRIAAKALQEYLQRTGGYQREEDSQLRRTINHYEENRAAFNKIFGKSGVTFPRWNDLTSSQKNVFLSEMVNNSGQQQNVAFAKLGVKILEDSRQLSEGEKRERQNDVERREKVRQESEAQQEKDKKTREAYERNKPAASTLPNNVIQMVMNNDLQGILDYMSSVKTTALTSPYKRIMKSVAGALQGLKLNTKIKIVESSEIDGDLAQYDPVTDTILVTREGLSSNTILHEIIHAGTVKIINEYLYGNKGSLSMGQLNAVKVLEKIMNETRGSLAESHPDAYKSLFEFVSYALTSDQLQQDLHDQSFVYPETKGLFGYFGLPREDIQTILPKTKSAWTAFKLSIARIIKVRDTYLHKGKLNEKVDPDFLMEINAAFEDILAKPTEPIYLPALPAKGNAPKVITVGGKKTPKTHKAERGSDNPDFHLTKEEKPPTLKEKFDKARKNVNTWRNAAKLLQDDRAFAKAHNRYMELSGKLIREGKDTMNNFYEHIVQAAGNARNFFNVYVSEPAKALDVAVKEFAESAVDKNGKPYTTKRALEELHKILEAIHEPERRLVKYLMSVPLSKVANLTHNGKQISAADRRVAIIKLLDTRKLTEAQAKQLREELDSIVFEKDANGDYVLDAKGSPKPNTKYVDPLGDTPYGKIQKNIDINSEAYTVTGIDLDDARKIREGLKNDPQAEQIQKVIDALQHLHVVTTNLNKLANYWSQPVSNRVAFYGFENYIPLKGNPKHNEVDDDIDFDSRKLGREMQDNAGSMDGRFSVSKNPILQTMTDASRAALRAGRRNLTQSIKNAILNKDANGKTVLDGYVKKTIKFEERNTVDLSDLKGETTIFHYNEDGSIDVLVVADKNMRDSIRRTYSKINPIVDLANKWTSRLGQMHTRYNYNFAPLNFVRDTLTNAWNIGASELGPIEAARYLKDVAFKVSTGGMYKAMQVAILFPKGDTQSLRALKVLSQKDPYIRDMVEYIQDGNMVSHLSGMSLQTTFEELHKKVGRSGIMTKVEDFNQFADAWTNMFELASRAAAYSVAKNNFITKKNMTEADARIAAGVFTKNLANFEQVGEWGKNMGALYMFFRPSATGAVRAIEAVAPAWTSLETAASRLPPNIANDPAAKAKYLENYKVLQRNSRIMSVALFSLGIMAYTMAYMTSDDDDLGRNAVATDNMEQWTRFARFHIPRGISDLMGLKEPLIFQMPWGFGLGAFAAAGAQIAGIAGGNQTFMEAMKNIFLSVALDSFLPIPVSRMPVTDAESAVKWAIDSAAPSFVRPLVEFAMNKNGLGQDINSAAQRRMGDAYTGGDNIPEMWKDAAAYIHDATDGYFDWSPNSLYFMSNSYVDGVSRLAETVYGITDLAEGRKNFSPKTDIPLLGSFFGTKANYDAREFGEVEKKIQHIEKTLNDFKTKPEKYADYVSRYPMEEGAVELYNKILNDDLNPMRAMDKTIRNNKSLSPAERKDLLQINAMQENLIKRQMIDVFKAYGIER